MHAISRVQTEKKTGIRFFYIPENTYILSNIYLFSSICKKNLYAFSNRWFFFFRVYTCFQVYIRRFLKKNSVLYPGCIKVKRALPGLCNHGYSDGDYNYDYDYLVRESAIINTITITPFFFSWLNTKSIIKSTTKSITFWLYFDYF